MVQSASTSVTVSRANPVRLRLGSVKPSRVYALAFLLVLGLAICSAPFGQAQTFTTLHNFKGSPDGAIPFGGVVRDKARSFYGTTEAGGKKSCSLVQTGCGTVFKLDTSGTETVLYNFSQSGAAGFWPLAGVVADRAGNLYGTTYYGGNFACPGNSAGCGTVFKRSPGGKLTVLHTFAGGTTDGCNPWGGLTRDQAGNLYGTTFGCGASNTGTIFQIDTKGNFTLLHSFVWYIEGQLPQYTSLLLDKLGNLYGVAAWGGSANQGTLYMLSPSGALTVLHNFAGGATDGCHPVGTPAMDRAGNFYGVTDSCGSSNDGIIWKVSNTGVETVLWNFTGGADGAVPFGGVLVDAKSNLYGDTSGGNTNVGSAYRLSASGKLKVLHTFASPNGYYPIGGLLRDNAGNLYGTTAYGGSGLGGTVFKLKP